MLGEESRTVQFYAACSFFKNFDSSFNNLFIFFLKTYHESSLHSRECLETTCEMFCCAF